MADQEGLTTNEQIRLEALREAVAASAPTVTGYGSHDHHAVLQRAGDFERYIRGWSFQIPHETWHGKD